MSTISSEAPSSRALRHLNNRNNVADLFLRKRLQQMEREKNFYMSYLDKDRLDITDFLKNLQKCDSDELPQSKIIREEWDSDDDLSDDVSFVPNRRKTHTAKTAPPQLRSQRKKGDDDDDDDDCVSLTDHHPRRHVRTCVPNRRQMLAQRRKEDRRAMESDYEKTEIFLRKLRQDIAKDQPEELRKYMTRREFTAYLLSRIRSGTLRDSSLWDGQWEREREEEEEEEEGERRWARSRLDMVYPIKRLGNIAARFQKGESGRNTPAGAEGGKSRFFGAPLKKMLGEVGSKNEPGSRGASAKRGQRQRSVFEITEEDPPAHLLPRPAGMPDFNRARRDTLVDTARAFGFGEAAVVPNKGSPLPQESCPSIPAPQVNPFSRAALAERRRLERQAKVKSPWHAGAGGRNPPNQKDDPHGTDMIRALMQIKARFRHKPLDDRIKDFMRELDDLEKAQPSRYRSECS